MGRRSVNFGFIYVFFFFALLSVIRQNVLLNSGNNVTTSNTVHFKYSFSNNIQLKNEVL